MDAQHYDENRVRMLHTGLHRRHRRRCAGHQEPHAAELRRIFTKNHGNLATSGSVSYMFHKKGLITAPL